MDLLFPTNYQADGFVLRAYQAGDGAALRLATTESYEHLKPFMPWAVADQTLEQAEAVARRLASGFLAGTDYTLGVWDGEFLIGGTGFHLRCGPIEWKCAEIGMWIHGERAGTGLGTRVLGAMLDWGFGEWGWERLVWKCDVANAASSRVAEKNGMTREAILRSSAVDVSGNRCDMNYFAKLKAQHQAHG